MLTALIPKVFYDDLQTGLDLFVEGIGMAVLHQDAQLVVAGRDACRVYLVKEADLAAKDRPEITIETDTIEAVYADISARRPDLLHPNPVVHTVTRRDWGAREFAMMDPSGVCVVFRDWS